QSRKRITSRGHFVSCDYAFDRVASNDAYFSNQTLRDVRLARGTRCRSDASISEQYGVHYIA
ncbi:hypothetical protein PENTCL1PPCAC_10265, partial [Pristionchus entomophagus]